MAFSDHRIKIHYEGASFGVELSSTERDDEGVGYYSAGQGFGGESPTDNGLRKCQIVWSRSSSASVTEDVAVCTLHLIRYENDVPTAPWVEADFLAAEAAIDAWWGTLKALYRTRTILSQLRWYLDGPAAVKPNPARRVVNRSVAGTVAAATTQMPPQAAMSITEQTPLRKRWGRLYLPSPAATVPAQEGTIGSAAVTSIANATATMYDAFLTANLLPVVYSPTKARAYSVTRIQVDDLFDVIRSRRFSAPTIRERRPA